MKRILIAIMVIMLVLTGCGSNVDTTKGKQDKAPVVEKDKNKEKDKIDLGGKESDSKDKDIDVDKKDDKKDEKREDKKDVTKTPAKDAPKKDTPKKETPTQSKPSAQPVITTKTEVKNSAIAFQNTNQNDNSRAKGDNVVSIAGVNGNKEIKYKVTYKDGVETGREVISETVTKKPVNQVTLIGTYVAPAGLTLSGNTVTGIALNATQKANLTAALNLIPARLKGRIPVQVSSGSSAAFRTQNGKANYIDMGIEELNSASRANTAVAHEFAHFLDYLNGYPSSGKEFQAIGEAWSQHAYGGPLEMAEEEYAIAIEGYWTRNVSNQNFSWAMYIPEMINYATRQGQ